jgi:hypothetical protein
MRIPASGGVPQLVLEIQNYFNHECARAPANLCVVLEENPDEKHLMVTAFDPLKGRGKVLRTIEKDPLAEPGDQASALSPDGSTFALSGIGKAEIHIRLLSLSGGSDREIAVKGWDRVSLSGLARSPDGKGLYCGSLLPQSRTLLYVDLIGECPCGSSRERSAASGAYLRRTAATSSYEASSSTATCGCLKVSERSV